MLRRVLFGFTVMLFAWGLTGLASTGATADTSSHANSVALLPAGYLSTAGNQLVPQGRREPTVRIAAVGWDMGEVAPLPTRARNVVSMRRAGFNTITIGWYNRDPHRDPLTFWRRLDAVVRAAGNVGMKVILNHHADEGLAGNGNCLAQHANGLWFDSGPGTDGTDGCGNPGTVTQEVFRADWEQIAHRYAGNTTVIGFDLHNEPLAYPGMSTWGDGSVTDIQAMYSTVGSALEAIDPGVLIICEGPQNYGGNLTGKPGITTPEGDLTAVASKPVTLTVNGDRVVDKVVYSVHEYPNEISGVDPDSGPAAVARFNGAWGYVVTENLAPVWIGEAGSSMQNNPDDKDWATTLTDYVNGKDGALGGPTFGVCLKLREAVGTVGDCWWWCHVSSTRFRRRSKFARPNI